jgi:hypothetical protein
LHVALEPRDGGRLVEAIRDDFRDQPSGREQSRDRGDGVQANTQEPNLGPRIPKSRVLYGVRALPLRAALTRGVRLVLATWPVVLIEFTASSLYRLALSVPVFGGALVVATLVGAEAHGRLSGTVPDGGLRARGRSAYPGLFMNDQPRVLRSRSQAAVDE